jgi:aspartate racemase
MKTIGMIGGMSWESSLEYYRIINQEVRRRLGGFHSAKCLLSSVDFAEIENLQRLNNWDTLTGIMINAAMSLKNGGADFVIICTNTMHKMADAVAAGAGIEILHIAEATGREVQRRGMKKVGLLGTKFTMEQDFYRKRLSENFAIETVIPDASDREIIHQIIYSELCQGVVKEESRQAFIDVSNRLHSKSAEGIVLGCTEIPLLLRPRDVDIPLFDTMQLHAVAAVEESLLN